MENYFIEEELLLETINLLFNKTLPEQVFKYFSKLKARYWFSKQAYQISFSGLRSFVAGTYPLLCLSTLSFKLLVQPIYG